MESIDFEKIFQEISEFLHQNNHEHSWIAAKDEHLEVIIIKRKVVKDVKQEPPIDLNDVSQTQYHCDLTDDHCNDKHERDARDEVVISMVDHCRKYDHEQSNLLSMCKEVKIVIEHLQQKPQENKIDNKAESSEAVKHRKKTGQSLMVKKNNLGLFACPLCEKSYKLSKDVNFHYKRKHAQVSLTCNDCAMQFREKFKLNYHRDILHNDGSGSYMCSHCEMKFCLKKSLIYHMRLIHRDLGKTNHSENSLKSFSCQFCPQNLGSNLERHHHVYTHHKDQVLFCKFCTKKFINPKSLENHQKRAHDALLISCEFCSKKFATSDSLSYHHDEYHDDEDFGKVDKPYVCSKIGCQKKFQTTSNLDIHFKIHESTEAGLATLRRKRHLQVSKVQCDICGKLISPGRINLHKLEKHTEGHKYECTECGKSFQWPHKLKRHRLETHAKRELICPIESCSKIFHHRNALNAHVKGVHGKSREWCTSCDKSFQTKADLTLHIKGVHLGLKSYCSFCGKDFIRPSEKNRHERHVHGAEKKTK